MTDELYDALGKAQTRRIEAKRLLDLEANRLRMPKDKDLTEWDRKVMLEAEIADKRADYETALAEEERIILYIKYRSKL